MSSLKSTREKYWGGKKISKECKKKKIKKMLKKKNVKESMYKECKRM